MADFTSEDSAQAKRIVDGLLTDQRDLPPIAEQLVVADLEGDAAEFTADLEMLEMIGADCPATRVEDELVPVALSLVIGPGWPWSRGSRRWNRRSLGHPFMHEWLYDILRFSSNGDVFNQEFQTIPIEQARATFSRRAVEFLATRIAAIRERDSVNNSWFDGTFVVLPSRIGGKRINTPGCNFSVSTNSRGLRVFWSGAYRITSNFFSAPTTPTIGVLQSGTYVFGVDGGPYGSVVQWDSSAVTSLPGNPHIHLNF